MFDGKAFGQEMVEIVKGHVTRTIEPLLARIDALEAELTEAKAFDPSAAIKAAVAEAIDAMPKAKDGEPGRDAEPYQPDPDEIRSLLAEIVEPALAAIPAPQDGKSVTIEDVEPLIAERVTSAISEAVKSIPVPKDGAPGRDGLDAVTPILKDGVLLFTMSDGSVKEVGHVAGKDGEPGRDGFGFDDLEVEHNGERGFIFRFARGEQVKEFPFSLPVVIDRGVWSEKRDGGYAKGDAVTWAGSVWISQKDGNDSKPDSGDGWRLSVKRGRDGKPGKDGELKAHQPVKVG